MTKKKNISKKQNKVVCKRIEPSLLSIIKKSNKEAVAILKFIKKLGLKYVHYDVMDGKFVHNTALNMQFLKEIKKLGLKATVHLMVLKPLCYLKKYFKFNVEAITFHVEPLDITTIKKYLLAIKNQKIKCGIAIKMETDLKKYASLNRYLDYITIMSVPPGKSGQTYNNKCLHNLKVAKKFKQHNPNLIVQIDGGINLENAKKNYTLVDHFIMGSYFFNNLKNMKKVIKLIKQ